MKRFFQSNIVAVAVLFAAAALILVLVHPEIFITFNITFSSWNDICVEYPPTFALTTFLYQGGLQLWDYFAQMPYFHTYAALGVFKFPNVVTALAYYLLAPFSGDSSRLFHHVFTWGYLMTILFIRIVGIFLLLKIVTRNRVILFVGTVIFAVFFCQIASMDGAFYRNYMPLGIYFLVRFFQDLQLRSLIVAFLFFIIVMGSEPLHGAYLYLPMHFFIMAGVLWRIFFNPLPQAPNRYFWNSWGWKDIAWVILVAVFILAPYTYIVKSGFHDLAFGQADSRISHPFSPQWYFHNPNLELGSPRGFFSAILNMQTLGIEFYLGISFLFLALAGLILNANKLKWFFAIGIFFLWLLSFPREGMNIGLIAHWINVLTNPLKTIPRSYQAAGESMFAYLLMPLAVMGIEAVIAIYRGKKFSGVSLTLLGIMTLLLVLNALPVLPLEVRVYLMVSAVLLSGGLGWIHFINSSTARNFFVGTICFLAIIDVFLIIHQSKHFTSVIERRPTVLDAAPQSGMVEYDFENPSIFPYRYSYTFNFSFRDEVCLWYPHGVSCDVHHVINQALNYTWLNGMNPRHVEFAKWLNDPPMMDYLKQNNEFIFLARAAINASPDALSRICSAGLARQVVEVEDPGRRLRLPDQWPDSITKKEGDVFQYSQILGTLDNSDYSNYYLQGDMMVYTLHLPSGFPEHLASSWFLPEQHYLRFFIEGTGGQWQELQATQGELIRPYTFDVQNIKKGDLKAAFPKNDFPLHRKYVLLYPSSENQGVEGLWRKQFDNLGIIYRAKRDGWLVGHYPYDTKWRISVDGKKVIYYRVNESFIGFPLARGEHKILIQYWPHSPLRILLLVSAILTTFGLLALIFLALKWEQQ